MPWSATRSFAIFLCVVVVFLACFVAGIFLFSANLVEKSGPFGIGSDFIRGNPVVAEKIGPVKTLGHNPWAGLAGSMTPFNVYYKVTGDKGSAGVRILFFNDNGKWVMEEAEILLPGKQDWFPIMPLEVREVFFRSESPDGPVNPDRIYAEGETIYWDLVVEKVYRQGGLSHLKEGLVITDAHEQIVGENPELVVKKGKIGSNRLVFKNNAVIPASGEYRLRIRLNDVLSGREAFRVETVKVVHSKTLKISGLQYRDRGPDGPVKNTGVYGNGESVFVTFDIVGFSTKGGTAFISENLSVVDNAGQVILDKPDILTIREAWAKDDLMALQNNIDITIPGPYKLKIAVYDHNSGADYTSITDFIIK